MPYKCVIIDDEISARNGLKKIIESQFSNKLSIIGEADGVQSGEELIRSISDIDLIFLDIKMRDGTGFDLLQNIRNLDIEVVFVTAFDQYAIKAFEFSAIGYLLKPISIKAIKEFLKNFELKKLKLQARQHLLIDKIIKQENKRIVLKHFKGFDIVLLDDIVRIESKRNYSEFHFADGKKLLISKTLKYYEDLLSDSSFYRIHQSHLINLNHVTGYNNKDGGYIQMSDNSHITVSKNKKAEFVSLLGIS